MIVADTNVISYLLLPTSFTEAAEILFARDSDWVAPPLWKSDFRNVLALYIRKQLITLKSAIYVQEQAETIVMSESFTGMSKRVLGLTDQSECSSYDCEFVALAQHFHSPLVTQDKKVKREFPDIAIGISEHIGS